MTKLLNFNCPTNQIHSITIALEKMCMTKAPSVEDGRTICHTWATSIIEQCEEYLEKYIMSYDNEARTFEVEIIEKKIFSLGEMALIGFDKNDMQVFFNKMQVKSN